MKTRIQKNAAATESKTTPAEVFELTSIKPEEVSLVDRAANGRSFLVKKRKTEKATAPAAETSGASEDEIVDLAATAKGAAPGAELDAADVSTSEVTEAEKVIAAKDAADAAAYAAEKAARAAGGEGAPVVTPDVPAAPAAAAKATPAVKAVDTAAALASLVTDAASLKKTDIIVTPGADGEVVVSVDAAPVVTPAAPAAVIDKVKAAVLAGIDAISERVTMFRSKVEADESASPWNMAGRPEICSDVWYIRDMLDALYDIGGARWEIETAGDEANKSVAKGHKAITGSRVAKLKAIHKGLSYCMKDYGSVMKELDTETEDAAEVVAAAAPALVGDVNKAAPAAPAVPASVEKDINELRTMVASLSKTVDAQAAQLAKSRDSVRQSNSAVPEETPQNRDKVIWPSDLANKAERVQVRR